MRGDDEDNLILKILQAAGGDYVSPAQISDEIENRLGLWIRDDYIERILMRLQRDIPWISSRPDELSPDNDYEWAINVPPGP